MKKNLSFQYSIMDDIEPKLFGDQFRLSQILQNVIDNAIKFTEKGKISLCVRLVKIQENHQFLSFELKDTGVGILQKDLQYIFDQFHQVDNSFARKHEGTGLGLAISKHLIFHMNGEIDVQSKTGEGTTFTFTIPFKISSPVARQENTDPLPPLSKQDKHVLVVDDNDVNRNVLIEMLEAIGIAAESAASGKEALKMIQNNYTTLLFDLHMPEMDGIELSQLWRKNEQRRGTIIIVSADTRPEQNARCMQAGIDQILPKPFLIKDLKRVLSL